LLNVVKDCFDNKDKAIAEEAELVATLDSMWIDIHSDSLGEIAKAFSKLGKKPEEKKEEPAVADSENPEGEEKDSKGDKDKPKEGDEKDSKEDKDKPKEGEDKDSKENKSEKDGCNKDSAPAVMTKDDMLAVLKAELPAMVQSAVKECLNIKDDKKPEVTGGVVDSKTTETGSSGNFDYESFLE
jgi:hypothetical protein